MKRILLGALMIAAISANAQDLKKIETAYVLKKYKDAKTEVDKAMVDPKNQSKPEFLYWQATVYGLLYDDEASRPQFPGALEVAHSSFMKYSQLDPTFKIMNDNIPGKAVVDFVYRNNLKHGISAFDQKQWDSSFKYFSRASEVGDYITKFDWRGNKQSLDTTTVLFSGYAAQNGKKLEDAVKFYSRIADNRITNAAGAGDIKDVYEFLLYYFTREKNNPEEFNKYLNLSQNLFPGNVANWTDYHLDFLEDKRTNATIAQKSAAYDKYDAAGTLTSPQYMAFGAMFYNIDDEEKAALDSSKQAAYRKRTEEAFVKAFNKDNANGLAAYNLGLINYNDWIALDEQYEMGIKKIREINSNKPIEKDPKKKAAADAKIKKDIDAVKATNSMIEKRQMVLADKGIEWLQKTYSVLTTQTVEGYERQSLGKAVDDLTNLFMWKRDKSKGNAAEYDKYDAGYKKYDALHGAGDINNIKPGMKKGEVLAFIGQPAKTRKDGTNDVLTFEGYKKEIFFNEKGEVVKLMAIEPAK